MKRIAVVICNWNKKDYVLKCIESVVQSSIDEYDIFVVDNASTDGSVEVVHNAYGQAVNLIYNEKNEGGAGGFNAGINIAMTRGYRYIHLLDNDAVIDRYNLEKSVEYLEAHEDVGAAGSKIYLMDRPQEIQEIGAVIDFERFDISLNYGGSIDDGSIPEVVGCDYAPACSLMLRAEAVKRVGGFDRDYFLYWDDIDFGYRIQKAGYKIVGLGQAKAWHKRGAAEKANTSSVYYFWRNRVHFFAKYLDKALQIAFASRLAEEMFQALFMCGYTGKDNSATGIAFAVGDALRNIRGRAPEGRIMDREPVVNKLVRILEGKKRVILIDGSSIFALRTVYDTIRRLDPSSEVAICVRRHSPGDLQAQFTDTNIVSSLAEYDADVVCEVCDHVTKFDGLFIDDVHVYVDQYSNVVYSKEDRTFIGNFRMMNQMFRKIYLPVLEQYLLELHRQLEQAQV